jgi:hypothetical protein
VGTAVRFEPGQITTVLCIVQVTNRPKQSGSVFWPGLQPNQTKPPVNARTTGALPRLIANTTHMGSTNLSDPKSAMMENILTLCLTISKYYLTIFQMQHTAWQYTAVRRSLSSICVVTRRIYRMNHYMQWSSVFTVVFRVKLKVSMVHAYPRCVDKHEARAVVEGIDRTNRCG